jgi:hypothetical protein
VQKQGKYRQGQPITRMGQAHADPILGRGGG